MKNRMTYKELIDFCDGVQNKKDILGWNTLKEFEHLSQNKNFDAKVYKRGDRIVIALAGTNIFDLNDLRNDLAIKNSKIPSQYADTEKLYNIIRERYPNAKIESTGYSLGATLSNLLSHRTGISSTVIAPIGSQHIAEKYKDYFKHDGSNITTYGRKGDFLFNSNINRQSGDINIVPNLSGKNPLNYGINHLLHKYTPIDLFQAKPAPTGFSAQLEYDANHIFTPEEIGNLSPEKFNQYEDQIMTQLQEGKINNQSNSDFSSYKNPFSGNAKIYSREDLDAMSTNEYSQNEKEIFAQMNSIGVPTNSELHGAAGTIYVESYTRRDGTVVKGYYRSV